MKKRSLLYILLFFIPFLLINTIYGLWVVDYKIESSEKNIDIQKYACQIDNYIVNNGSQEANPYASYASLESAINSAKDYIKNNITVNMYLKVGSHALVSGSNLTLASGMSLFLPYEGLKSDITSDDELKDLTKSFVDISNENIKKYNVSSLTFLNSSLIVDNGASLFIGGIFGEKGVCGKYSQINLDNSSKITIKGEMICYGYVKSRYSNNKQKLSLSVEDTLKNSQIICESNSKLTAPLIFYDAGGNGELTSLNENGVFPVNIFDFPTIQTNFKINAGAFFYGQARLYRNAGTEIKVNKNVPIVLPQGTKSDNGCLFQTSGSSDAALYFSYTPKEKTGFTYIDSTTSLFFEGEIYLNAITIDLGLGSLAGDKGKITTDGDVFLPLSYKFRLYIGSNAKFHTNGHNIKFLGGSLLHILKGGIFYNEGKIICYKNDTLKTLRVSYPTNYGDATFIVDGTFEMASSSSYFGGYISTNALDENASLIFSNVAQSNLTCSTIEGVSKKEISFKTSGCVFDGTNNQILDSLLKSKVIIKSIGNKNCWGEEGRLVSYKLSILVDDNNYESPLGYYRVYEIDESNNENDISVPKGNLLTSSSDYLICANNKFRIEVIDAKSTNFIKRDGIENPSISFINNNQYTINGENIIEIECDEGIDVRFSMDNESGAGGSTVKIYNGTTSNGPWSEIASSSGGTKVETIIKKDTYVKYVLTGGNAKGKKILGDHYLFEGFINVASNSNDDKNIDNEIKSAGTKLYTSFTGNNLIANDYLLAGSTSTSITKISAKSTIHAFIDKKEESGDGGGCYSFDTPILLADGTYKPVYELNVGDEIMVINHDSGKFEPGFISYIYKDETMMNEVMNLCFDNGKNIEVITGHCFFDKSVCEYVEIRPDNVKQFMSHEFYYYDVKAQKGYYTKLVDVQYYKKFTAQYAVIAAYHMNCVANGFVNITDEISGLYNYFECGEDLKFDAAKKQEDIKKYGLYAYEEWSEWFSREQFELFNVKYLKVSVGKGLLSEEKIKEYVNRYLR